MPTITLTDEWVLLSSQNCTFQQITKAEAIIKVKETQPDENEDGFVLTRKAINKFEYKGVPLWARAKTKSIAEIYVHEGVL